MLNLYQLKETKWESAPQKLFFSFKTQHNKYYYYNIKMDIDACLKLIYSKSMSRVKFPVLLI